MINPFADINWKPNESDIRKFGRTLAIVGLGVAGALILIRFLKSGAAGKLATPTMIFAIIGALGCYSAVLPGFAKPIYHVWFFIGACLGTVISNLVLMLFYYLLFTPVGLIMRLTGRDALRLKRRERKSMWVDHKKPASPAQYYHQF